MCNTEIRCESLYSTFAENCSYSKILSLLVLVSLAPVNSLISTERFLWKIVFIGSLRIIMGRYYSKKIRKGDEALVFIRCTDDKK